MDSSNQLISLFENLNEILSLFKIHLSDLKSNQIWINDEDHEIFSNNTSQFIEAITDFYPSPFGRAQQTSSYQGALGGNQETLKLTLKLNDAKDNFRKACHEIMIEQRKCETALIHKVLKDSGFPSLKLKQIFRHIPILDYHPRLISYCKTRHNSKLKISKNDAEKRLIKVGKGGTHQYAIKQTKQN